MATETNIQHGQKNDPANHTNRAFAYSQRSALLSSITFLILAFLGAAIIYQRYINLKHDKNDAALTVANNARIRLQETLAYSLSATKLLSFFIQKDGRVTNFDSIAAEILKAGDDLDAVQIVPGGVIRYMFPLKGNEKVIGYDILKDASRNKEALMAIEKIRKFNAIMTCFCC